MRRATLIFAALSILATVGCKKKEEVPKAPAEPAPSKVSPALPLMDKLAFEAAHRTKAGITVEGFWAALEKNGMPVTEQKQHVASVFGARYCGGATAGGVHADICEYDNDADAQSGVEIADKAFGKVANLKHLAHHAAMLSVRPDEVTPESEAALKKITDLFNAQ